MMFVQDHVRIKSVVITVFSFSICYHQFLLLSASFLQESDMFMDALTASTKKEPRKRKRRTSSSKDGPEAKKEAASGKEEDISKESTPTSSPTNTNEDNKSPPIVRPLLKVSHLADRVKLVWLFSVVWFTMRQHLVSVDY
jgi:hypothetical protein